jgi:hypothetical protein
MRFHPSRTFRAQTGGDRARRSSLRALLWKTRYIRYIVDHQSFKALHLPQPGRNKPLHLFPGGSNRGIRAPVGPEFGVSPRVDGAGSLRGPRLLPFFK